MGMGTAAKCKIRPGKKWVNNENCGGTRPGVWPRCITTAAEAAALTLPELDRQIALLKYRVESRLSASLRRSAFQRLVWLEEQGAHGHGQNWTIFRNKARKRELSVHKPGRLARGAHGRAPATGRHLFESAAMCFIQSERSLRSLGPNSPAF